MLGHTCAMPRRARAAADVLGPLRHELRNTLTPIAMIVDVLAVTAPRPELDILGRDIRRLSLALDDLFEVTRVLPAPRSVAKRRLELAAVVSSVVEDTDAQRQQLGASLAVNVPAKLYVFADPSWLRIALASIVRHATTRTAQLALTARRAGKSVHLALRTAPAPLPDHRALDLARRLVELQGGRWTAREDLGVSFPAAPAIG